MSLDYEMVYRFLCICNDNFRLFFTFSNQIRPPQIFFYCQYNQISALRYFEGSLHEFGTKINSSFRGFALIDFDFARIV